MFDRTQSQNGARLAREVVGLDVLHDRNRGAVDFRIPQALGNQLADHGDGLRGAGGAVGQREPDGLRVVSGQSHFVGASV